MALRIWKHFRYNWNFDILVCTLPKDEGFCYALIDRWYFNGKNCEKFIYHGCLGNANNFNSVESCQAKCGPWLSSHVSVCSLLNQNCRQRSKCSENFLEMICNFCSFTVNKKIENKQVLFFLLIENVVRVRYPEHLVKRFESLIGSKS